jgi:hypothetical protein
MKATFHDPSPAWNDLKQAVLTVFLRMGETLKQASFKTPGGQKALPKI